MADLYQIQLPSGSTYDLRDSRVDNLNNWSYVVCSTAADTPKDIVWDKSGTTITGTLVASSSTMYKIYLVPDTNGTNDTYDEYITVNPSGSTYNWEMFGNTKLPDMDNYVKNKTGHSGGTAGDLAYKDTASGSVTVPKTYTSTWTGTGVRLQTDSQVMTGASFTGDTITSTGTLTTAVVDVKPNSTGTSTNKYTPAGSISVGTGTANYTPAGTISVDSAGSTTTIHNPTKNTVVTDMSVATPSATQATGEMIYTEVSGTKLILKKIVETTGDSISTTDVTVKNGDASYSFGGTGAQLKFSGTATYLKTVSKVVSGDSVSVSVTGTTAGSITPTKSNVTVSPTTGTATYTPGGSVTTSTNTTESKTVTVS